MQPQIRKISVVSQPWVGTPRNPKFLTPIYEVEYEVAAGQRQQFMRFPATDGIQARQIASRKLNIPFVMQ
jgi:hypothetical protein